MLAPYFTVVAPDLPGHGFTDSPASNSGFTLPRVARNVSALLAALELRPTLAVGHSAGAAVAIRMALDRSIAPVAVVSLNGALLPFPGMTNDFLAPAIRFLATTSLAAKAFTVVSGSRTSVERMMRSTGSHIDAEGMRLYARLAGNAGHVHGAMALMANWDLRPLVRDLPYLPSRLVLVTGSQDGMVPPAQANRVKAVLPKAELVSLPGLGHLAHEEQPADIAELLRRMVPHEASG
jgi:magnesium chelatase accessory protein